MIRFRANRAHRRRISAAKPLGDTSGRVFLTSARSAGANALGSMPPTTSIVTTDVRATNTHHLTVGQSLDGAVADTSPIDTRRPCNANQSPGRFGALILAPMSRVLPTANGVLARAVGNGCGGSRR